MRAKKLASQSRENKHFYEHQEIGYNYRMTNLAAGIGLGQMRSAEEKIRKRRAIFKRYQSLLKQYDGIKFLEEREGSFSNRWLTTIVIDPTKTGFTNNDIRLALQKNQIETRFLWKPLHLQPVFLKAPYYGGNTASSLFNNGLCLPSSSQLSLEEQLRVVEVFEKEFTKVC
jgi:dTDP-4-amino-4,6-dideoxygalactose transaminase